MAQPATQAPNTRAENPGQTSMQAWSSSPGHWPELLSSNLTPVLTTFSMVLNIIPGHTLQVSLCA